MSTNRYGTRHVETEAFLAVISEDTAYLAEMLDTMLPGELRKLESAADELAVAVAAHREKRAGSGRR